MADKEYKKILIIGPQASGKGTQAEALAEKLGVPHVSLGEKFREIAKSGTPLGMELKRYMDLGELVPETLNNRIVKELLEEHGSGFILDGYPRTPEQAEFLDAQTDIDVAIVLEVPDEVSIERISGRRVCPDGHDYHIQYKPPKQEGICDIDGKELMVRDDDQPEAIKKRLSIYHSQTEPIIAHYESKGKVIKIDGTPSIKEVTNTLLTRLGLE